LNVVVSTAVTRCGSERSGAHTAGRTNGPPARAAAPDAAATASGSYTFTTPLLDLRHTHYITSSSHHQHEIAGSTQITVAST
jgi:hypothetical protein